MRPSELHLKELTGRVQLEKDGDIATLEWLLQLSTKTLESLYLQQKAINGYYDVLIENENNRTQILENKIRELKGQSQIWSEGKEPVDDRLTTNGNSERGVDKADKTDDRTG